jgi:hypothetical protein
MTRTARHAGPVPEEKIAAVFPNGGEKRGGGLPRLCAELYDAQKRSWPAFARAAAFLADVRIRELSGGGCAFKVQFNPVRMKSGTARVDADAIAARPCFLCPNALYPEQKGVLYRNAFLILCNPAPIFPGHLTIAALTHRPQVIAAQIESFLALAGDLGEGTTLFYNGPACGASAPDHLHFQAVPAGAVPIEGDWTALTARSPDGRADGVDLWSTTSWGRTLLMARGRELRPLAEAMRRLIAMGGIAPDRTGEPMINILAFFRTGEWRLCLFPRRRHRPAAYDRPDPERLLVTPGAVEMGGFVVTPREMDFVRLDAETLRGIYREVSAPPIRVGDLPVSAGPPRTAAGSGLERPS